MEKIYIKSFFISSHSEHFVVSLLNLVEKGKASPDDIAIYFIAKDEHNMTTIARQTVNDKGQIEGGLKSFYEPSMRALEEFLGTETKKEHANPPKWVDPRLFDTRNEQEPIIRNIRRGMRSKESFVPD